LSSRALFSNKTFFRKNCIAHMTTIVLIAFIKIKLVLITSF